MNIGNGTRNRLIWRENENRYHMDDHTVDLNDTNNSYALLSRRVKDGATVLDIACGEGRWGAALSQKKCKIYGIDIDATALKSVNQSGQYLKTWKADIEYIEKNEKEFNELRLLKNEIDYIGLLDVLEHTVNPTKVIENVSKLLNFGKKILISVPNIGHADIFLNLMCGKFNYQNMGILDNTHTKGFTKSSFLEWIQEMNEYEEDFSLDCEYIGGTFGNGEYIDRVKEKCPHLYSIIQLNPEYNVVQLLFEITKIKKHEEPRALKMLLERGKTSDILNVLESRLEESNTISELNYPIMNWNERKTYETQINNLIKTNQDLQKRWEEGACGWTKCNESYSKTIEELKRSNFEWKACADGWKACENELQASENRYKELEKQLDLVRKEWETSDRGWKNCLASLEKVNEQLNTVKKEKEEEISRLQKKYKDSVKKEQSLQDLVSHQQRRIYQYEVERSYFEKNFVGKLLIEQAKRISKKS